MAVPTLTNANCRLREKKSRVEVNNEEKNI